ncbi:MAG TPA: nuclear transport factor 2 family protein [Polyangia bacterium]|nr:nuclear transport factor 2 family protein [Polyangia bacterium]
MLRRLVPAVLGLTIGSAGTQAQAQAQAQAQDPQAAAPAARALVERWLSSQNGGDFVAYQALYATRFTGVRRSGARIVHLDRAGWMRDRGRMFSKKMVVAAEGVEIAAAPAMVRVTLTQKWESGSYKDVGKKELILVREGEAWKIAREEMLDSRMVASAGAAAGAAAAGAATARDRFAFVVADGVVLDSAPRKEWERGPPELLSDGFPMVVARSVDASRLPSALTSWRGRTLRLLSAGGKSCEAAVTGFRLIGRQVPHFGQREQWQGKAKPLVAAEAWDQSDHVLVATLAPGCTGTWARAAELPAPALADATPAEGALRAAALRELRRLPAYAAIQKSFREENPKGTWEQAADSPRVDVLVMRARGKTLVSVSARAGAGCGGFEGELFAVWEATGEKLSLRGTADGYLVPAAAVDLDGDGTLEILYRGNWIGDFLGQGVLRLEAGVYRFGETITVPYHDCPC